MSAPDLQSGLGSPAPAHIGSSIECLPVELLVKIFLQSQTSRVSQEAGPFMYVVQECQRPVTNWVPLMSVCRCFRDVILAAPIMWSRVHVTNDLATLERNLSRFNSSPLDLLFDNSWEAILFLIQPHASRIRAIITSPRFHVNSLFGLIPLFKLSLPALEHVHIDPDVNLAADSEEWQRLRDAGSILNDTLHPGVKMVTSYRLLLPSQESRFWAQKLVYLDIRCQGGPITTEYRDDLLAVLRMTRHLESLAITFAHVPPPDAATQMPEIVQVPLPRNFPREAAPLLHLRKLTLCGPTWISGYVLHGIDAPSLERFYLKIIASQQQDENAIVDIFPRWILHFLARDTQLHIHAAPSRDGFRVGDCHCETGRVTSDRFSLHVDLKGWWWAPVARLNTALFLLCRVFVNAQLETLEVNYFMGQPPEVDGVWRSVLDTFSGLKKLTLFGNDRKSGAAMVNAIQALQREGLNPEMELVAKSTDWGT